MKCTNNVQQHEANPMSLKEKVAKALGERLAKMAVGPRCAFFPVYEVALSSEMIEDMISNQ